MEPVSDEYEIARLKALLAYAVLDSPEEKEFDDLARLACMICNTPIALISFIDDKRQWYKAKVGMDAREVPIQETICQYTIQQNDLLLLEDARLDPRLVNNPHVTPENGVRFYAGLPLVSMDGYPIGTVCVVGTQPQSLNDMQIHALRIIGNYTMQLLESRIKNKDLGSELSAILEEKMKEAESQLVLKQKEYSNLFAAISKSNGIIEFDAQGKIEWVNDRMIEALGWKLSELVGQSYSVLVGQLNIDEHHHIWEVLQKGEPVAGTYPLQHKVQGTIWVQATFNPIADVHGKVQRVTCIAQNITSEIQSRLALEKAKTMAEGLSKQKDHFIANMSHEIRTPINAIMGFADVLQRAEKDPEKQLHIQAIQTASDALLHLVNDILDVSKIEAGLFQIDPIPFDLNALLQQIGLMMQGKAAEKGITFSIVSAADVPTHIVLDKNRVSQMLINLIGNAIKFTAHGEVKLQVLKSGNYIKFEISDTGIGIAADKLKTIFERFSQAEHDTTRKFGGTGLGLNITRQLAELHGGFVEVQSTIGKGSIFTISLPLIEAPAEYRVNQTEPVSEPQVHLEHVRILMCEDNELNQRLVRAIFKDLPYHLDIAGDGAVGIQMLEKQPYHLVLMDLQMPELDGYAAAQKIRNTLKLHMPIIALTAHALVSEREKCEQAGMNDYIAKPFRREELLVKIAYWLQHKPAQTLATPNIENQVAQTQFSLAQLNELGGGDNAFINEMLMLFKTQSAEAVKELPVLVAAQNWPAVKSLAHKLKTSFGIIAADMEYLHQLETAAQNANSEKTTEWIPNIVHALTVQIQNLHKHIDAILK